MRISDWSSDVCSSDLLRARVAADREAGIVSSLDGLLAEAASAPLLLAGNLLSPAMIAELGAAAVQPVAPLRSVALGRGANAIAGTPTWLRRSAEQTSEHQLIMSN